MNNKQNMGNNKYIDELKSLSEDDQLLILRTMVLSMMWDRDRDGDLLKTALGYKHHDGGGWYKE